MDRSQPSGPVPSVRLLTLLTPTPIPPAAPLPRAKANLAALELAHQLAVQGRSATTDESAVLALWSGWGAIPQFFDDPAFASLRDRLAELAGPQGYRAARRTVLNAHYTHPDLATALWDALARTGYTGGQVLEPGCGVGTFLATAPAGTTVTGVELDPSTALIAAALHPAHHIRAESFAETRGLGQFDAVIGNVPFGKVVLHDPRHNRAGFSIHNHFLVKSLDLLRPGGVMVALTSRFTLDARNPNARLALGARADLVCAVRLPTGAHQQMAGTQAVTDVLVLRRHDRDQPDAQAGWLSTKPLGGRLDDPGDDDLHINAYFHAHPSHVLGSLELDHGMHGAATLAVRGQAEDTATRLSEVLKAAIEASPLRWSPPPPPVSAAVSTGRQAPADPPGQGAYEGVWPGHLIHTEAGWFVAEQERWEPLRVPKSQYAELRELLGLRDQALALVERESNSRGLDPGLEQARERTARLWRAYVEGHGPLNRVTDAGRRPPVMRLFYRDPHSALVLALEDIDRATGAATPAPLLRHRITHAAAPPERCDDPADALAGSLNSTGRVDVQVVAAALQVPPQIAREQLLAAGLVFADHTGPERLVTSAEYLSGNVRAKLAAARTAADTNPDLAGNVEALRRVLPAELGIDEIEARMGAAWIPAQVHEQFLRDLGEFNQSLQHRVVEASVVALRRPQLGSSSRGSCGAGC